MKEVNVNECRKDGEAGEVVFLDMHGEKINTGDLVYPVCANPEKELYIVTGRLHIEFESSFSETGVEFYKKIVVHNFRTYEETYFPPKSLVILEKGGENEDEEDWDGTEVLICHKKEIPENIKKYTS